MNLPTKALAELVAEGAVEVCSRLQKGGHRGWIVGGCVRDLLMGRPVNDWDIATDAHPRHVMRLFPRTIPTGIEHGTVTVLLGGASYEVTTLRGETTYSDGRRPDKVVFVEDLSEDLSRRDFTVNAIALDPLNFELVDPFDGQGDLVRRTLRAVGDPVTRFTEDGLRPLRAARFSATLEFEIEPATLAAIGRTLSIYRKVSRERIRDEWLKAMKARKPSRAFEVMRTTGMLALTAPVLLEMYECEQNRYHAFDVWGHTMACLDACEGDPILRVAALLHDIGKPKTRASSDKTGDSTFYRHEIVGAELAAQILDDLRFSNEERERVTSLISHHLICYSDEWSDAAVRRFVRRVTRERLEDLYALARADARAKGKDEQAGLESIDRLEPRVRAVLDAKAALSVRELAIDGRDVMRELGIPPSRRVGEILEALLERVVDDPSLNERARLLELLPTLG